MITKLFYVHLDVLFFKKVPIYVPSPCHSKRIGHGPGQTDTVLLKPRQWWRGRVIEEGDLLTSVAAQLRGYVLTAWPRSEKEGQVLGSNPAPTERAPKA